MKVVAGNRIRSLRRLGPRLVVLATVAACTPPAPTAPKQAEPLPLSPPPANRPPPRQTLHATWRFQATPGECVATALANRTTVTIAAHPNAPIRVELSTMHAEPAAPARPKRMEMRFSGPAGRWQLPGAATGEAASVPLGAGDVALGRVLVMLSGGTIDAATPGQMSPLVSLPPSGPDGTRWFNCVHNALR